MTYYIYLESICVYIIISVTGPYTYKNAVLIVKVYTIKFIYYYVGMCPAGSSQKRAIRTAQRRKMRKNLGKG